ncbi:AraC family transcriptional regulator [Methylococcus geothermalis]|uniref:Helix-turn-helix domain-containing protein n=1 Tax=Methylococcus geothermalis TaxID=2681310 RepID=A0A858Q4R7_9GAMM|nr:AraC family transcriptional regulator [Methylococcus geothermalis]QJD28840.1 helix-turn-helix domain-containing protein [Methylococcus geothermalis]
MNSELLFDSAALPERDRFDSWREVFCSKMWGLDIVPTDPCPFFARCRFVSLGAVGVGRNELSGADYIRTPESVRAHDSDDFGFHLCLRGGSRIVQAGRHAEMVGLSGTLLASDQPGIVSILSKSGIDRYQGYCLHLPRKGLLQRVPRAERHLAEVISARQPLSLLVQYLDLVFSNDAALQQPELNELAGEHVLDIIALLLEPRSDAAYQSGRGGLRAARRTALLKYLEQHYRDDRLSVKTAAAALGISESYLHRLMAESGESFTETVNRLRLEQAKRMLEDPGCDRLRIGEIAFATGFSDFTYFNRLFRRRFGDTPGAFRADRPERRKAVRSMAMGARPCREE